MIYSNGPHNGMQQTRYGRAFGELGGEPLKRRS